ncbi:MAG: CoA-transferase [Candidatus Latescibacter sp.]|nr:CoA-transferase [Candidatus Latescibacter sp.]
MAVKLCSAAEAITAVKDGMTIATAAFGGMCGPEELLGALEERFLREGHPRGVTLLHAAGQGDYGGRGTNHFRHEGFLRRIIGGHFESSPSLHPLIFGNKIEAYNFPQGTITHMIRAAAAKRPGVLTHVGLGTFIDPRIEGGRLNDITTEDLVSVMTIEGKEWLFYKTVPIDIALIRGSTGDERGNITCEREGVKTEMLPLAQAVHNRGGVVIAQVEHVAKAGTFNPWNVQVPGILVDMLVVARPEHHMQSYGEQYNPGTSGELKIPTHRMKPLPLTIRKVIARRAFMEIADDSVINLGIGMPAGVGAIAGEEGAESRFALTVESGTIGGIPLENFDFGMNVNVEAITGHHEQFDFYDGGGLDVTFLGFLQIDREGNVNSSKVPGKVAGVGGFVNISQNAKKAVFMGSFTAKGLEVEVHSGGITIRREGEHHKFVKKVDQISFSGRISSQGNQEVLYITERAVFRLTGGRIELCETAPGIDIKRDILDLMAFKPDISNNLKIMDRVLFGPGKMGDFVHG